MKRNEDFRNALGEPDEYFQQSVMDTLNQLNRQAERESRPKWNFSMRLVSSFAALVLVIGGIVIATRNDHRDYLTPVATSPVDITATAQTTVTPLASPTPIETEHAVLTFTEAVRDGSDIRITVDIRPKNEHTLALNANHLLSTSVQYVSDLYGIQPDSPEQSLYEWAVEHGFPKALAVDLNAPSDDTPGPVSRLWHIEKHTLREDGSALMTIVGPAADNDVYDLEFHIIPWNMEDKGESFLPGLHDGGSIRLTLTDSTSHVPQLEVSGIKYPFSMSEEEYSRKAWGLSLAEAYTDLMNNTDARIGQVYCIKGVVQEVLSASPMRVLINTSEDGSSQPVIVESPSYRPFLPWKAGEFYRIYADVSYMDDNIPVLTARYIHTYAQEYEQENTQENEQEYVETDQAILKIQEAVTDGYGVFLYVEVTPKKEKNLAVNWGTDPYVDSPEKIGITPDRDGQTVAEWAVEHGYENMLQVTLASPWREESATSAASFDSFYNNSLTIADTDFPNAGTTMIKVIGGALPDTSDYDLGWQVVPWDMTQPTEYTGKNEKVEHMIEEKRESGTIKVHVTETNETPESFAEYISTADPERNRAEGEISVALIHTSQASYYEVRTREEKYAGASYCVLSHGHESFGSYDGTYMFYHATEPDNSTVLRWIWHIPEEMPDELDLDLILEDGKSSEETLHHLKKLDEAETETASVKVLEAVADTSNICLTVEVTPKSEKCLVVNFDVTPSSDSPEKIGQVPDSRSQTITEWAAAHGYDKVIRVTLSSSMPESLNYTSPSAESMLDSYSNGTELTENGSTILRATGKPIPGQEIYDLFCNLMSWELGTKDSYRQEQVIIPVHVPDSKQEPLLIAKYRLASDPVNVDKMTVSIYRSQVSDYAEFRTKDRDYFFRHAHLLDENRDMNAYSGTVIHSISQEYEDDDTTYVYRLPCKLPEELPDTLIMVWSDRPDEPIVRVDTRTVEPDQTINP